METDRYYAFNKAQVFSVIAVQTAGVREGAGLLKCPNFLPLRTTSQRSVSAVQTIPQQPAESLLLWASSLQNIALGGKALVRFSGTTFHSRVPLAREPQLLVQTELITWQEHLASMWMRAGWKTRTLASERFQGLEVCFISFIHAKSNCVKEKQGRKKSSTPMALFS